MLNQNKLAIFLSKLKELEKTSVSLEQYQTNSDIAAKILWWAYMQNDIKNKVIADFGCGNGVFGIGCLLLDANRVYFIDKDEEAIKVAKENYKGLKNGIFLNKDIKDFNEKVDVVIENPPFGVQKEHADREFLEQAFKISDIIYSFHKIESEKFINSINRGLKKLNQMLICLTRKERIVVTIGG